jgi:phosphoribosylglycinamide formyltransferase-1
MTTLGAVSVPPPPVGTSATPVPIVALVSGSGTLLQALIDASTDPAYGVRIVAVGADRPGTLGEQRAQAVGIPTFVCRVADFATRAEWDAALTAAVAAYAPAFVATPGFMKLLGPVFLARFAVVNTHPALLPAFPGAHAVSDALAYGVTVTGTTCHFVDAGVDTGPIIEQHAVAVEPDDTVDSLHERIKVLERAMLVDVVGRLARSGFTVSGRKVTIP